MQLKSQILSDHFVSFQIKTDNSKYMNQNISFSLKSNISYRHIQASPLLDNFFKKLVKLVNFMSSFIDLFFEELNLSG